jgi:hypothetical protein
MEFALWPSQSLDVAADRVLCYPPSVFQILPFCHKPRQGRHGHRVAAVFVGLEKRRVFVDLAFPIPHGYKPPLATSLFSQQRHKLFNRHLTLSDDRLDRLRRQVSAMAPYDRVQMCLADVPQIDMAPCRDQRKSRRAKAFVGAFWKLCAQLWHFIALQRAHISQELAV